MPLSQRVRGTLRGLPGEVAVTYRIYRSRDAKGKPLARGVMLHNGIQAENEADALRVFLEAVPLYKRAYARGELSAVSVPR